MIAFYPYIPRNPSYNPVFDPICIWHIEDSPGKPPCQAAKEREPTTDCPHLGSKVHLTVPITAEGNLG